MRVVHCVLAGCVLLIGCGGAGKSDGRLIVFPDESSDRVTARLMFDYNPAQLPAGTAWMVASALNGTLAIGKESELGELAGLGVRLTATAEREVVRVDLTFPPTAVNQVARLVAQRLSHPTFDNSRIDELRLMQHGLLDSLRHDADWLRQSTFWAAAYEGTPYALPPIGSDSSIELIQLSDLESFHSRFLTRGNYHLGLAGPVGPADAEVLDAQLQEALPAGSPAIRIPAANQVSGLEVTIVELPEVTATTISVGCTAPHLSDDTAAMVLAMTAVLEATPGLSMTGMDQSIRAERGMAEFVSGRTSWVTTTQSGVEVRGGEPSSRDFMTFTVRTDPTNALYSARIIIKEFADVSTAGLANAEIAQMHHSLQQAVAESVNTSTRMHNQLSRLWMGIENKSEPLRSKPEALNLTQSRRILRTVIDPKNFRLVAVVADAERFRAEILSGMTTYVYPDWVDRSLIRRLDQEYLSYRPFWQTDKVTMLHADSLFR